MKRLLTAVFFLGGMSALAYFVLTHPSVDKRKRLQKTVNKLEEQNRDLTNENKSLRQQIHQLKSNPRAAIERARHLGGLARPNEVIYHFKDPKTDSPVRIDLEVKPESINFEGQNILIDQLGGKITEFRGLVSKISLLVQFHPDVGHIRRQKIRDIIKKTSLEKVTFQQLNGSSNK